MRVLYLAHRVPYRPNRGDRIRAHNTIRYLTNAGHDVHVLALAHSDEEASLAAELSSICASWNAVRVRRARNLVRAVPALATRRALTHLLLDSPDMRPAIDRAAATFRPDVVFSFCSGVAAWALEEPLRGVPLVLDLVDVDSAKWADYAASARGPARWVYGREARLMAAFERQAMRSAAATLVVNEREAAAARSLAPGARVLVVGNGVDVEAFARPADAGPRRARVVFTAVFDYRPNEEGALWFTREVWPLVRSQRRDAELVLVGANPTARVRALGDERNGVLVTGAVPDVREYLWTSRVAIAPLFIARGIQNKVLEAAAAGLSCVVTGAVFEGLPPLARSYCRVANDSSTFAAAVLGALDGSPTVPDVRGLDWKRALAPLDPLLAEISSKEHLGCLPCPGRR